ncbi:hypothetical protein C2845_PM05G06460 [Panicum miliaceum]|uniref:Pectinesterase inhibitor domain-containing protein n=1 Tax=Panicum miliaceum TaxID=4540 RepID=A0A3L6SVQ7_PANMI|nr:hypothetical protein C2845_PM05G06460 [Panicum miliaceum]
MNVTMASSFSRASLALLLGLLLTAAHTKVAADVDPLLPICKTVGGGSTFFGIEFCMAALGSDSRSRNVSGEDPVYSTIAVDLLTANATSTAAKIDGILRNGGGKDDDATRQSLRSCRASYAGIVRRLPGCAAAVKARKYSEATASLEASAGSAKGCEDEFAKRGVASPLTAEDKNAFKLAKLAVALLRFTF